ncbi:GntR family transcriptional regulator [bacterium]|nr:MAG: GntR family transcriptional regulator [bacterium]
MNTTELAPHSARPPLPLYRQVENYLRDQIESGALQSGDLLPSVKELCDQFGGINHLTVRQAIKSLVDENLVRSVQGRGSFVTERKTRDQRIALVLPHLEDTLFIRIAKGAQEYFESVGIRTIILDSRGSETTEADHIQNLKNLPLQGALIFPIARSDIAEQIFKLKIEKFCFVLVDRYFEEIAAPCVVVDNYDGGYQSANYLAQRGRKCVGWIGELRSGPARLRLEGFKAALNDNGLACPGNLIKDVEVEPSAPIPYHQSMKENVRAAIDILLEEQPTLDAIVCCDDFCALIALEYLQSLGKRVPNDIALIGFDDVPGAETSRPALTTVKQPMQEMGREAARLLAERMKNPALPPEKVVLPVQFILRETA